jgi:hemoglobin
VAQAGSSSVPAKLPPRLGLLPLAIRHLPFAIDESARDQWMYCMIRAMHLQGMDDALMTKLAEQLYGVADFMRNQ